MAHIRKKGESWVADVCVNRKRRSKSFTLKRDAIRWAEEQEEDGILARHTVHEAIDKYRPISEKKRGSQAQLSRLKALETHFPNLPLESVTPTIIANWRDQRATQIKTVRIEMVVLGLVFKQCRNEWGWMRHDPMATVKKPPVGKPRRRGITQSEIDQICLNLQKARAGEQVKTMFLLSIETGMRLGELLQLTWNRVGNKTVTLLDTKNGDDRHVSLSQNARLLIAKRRDFHPDKVFTLSPHVVSKTFQRYTVNGVHFHDARSEAITRLSKKLDVMQLAKMIGHRDLKSLMIYYAESPEAIADRL